MDQINGTYILVTHACKVHVSAASLDLSIMFTAGMLNSFLLKN